MVEWRYHLEAQYFLEEERTSQRRLCHCHYRSTASLWTSTSFCAAAGFWSIERSMTVCSTRLFYRRPHLVMFFPSSSSSHPTSLLHHSSISAPSLCGQTRTPILVYCEIVKTVEALTFHGDSHHMTIKAVEWGGGKTVVECWEGKAWQGLEIWTCVHWTRDLPYILHAGNIELTKLNGIPQKKFYSTGCP